MLDLIQIDEENNAEKSDENQPITDEEEEEVERQPNDMFFSVVEKDQRIDVVAGKKIKEEPYDPHSTISEEPEIEEYIRSILNSLSEHQSFQTEQNVKIEYINGYKEDPEEQPSLGVIVEKVEASDRKPNV